MRRLMRSSSASTQMATPPFRVTASGLRAAPCRKARCQRDGACERTAEALARDGRERLVGALKDALVPM